MYDPCGLYYLYGVYVCAVRYFDTLMFQAMQVVAERHGIFADGHNNVTVHEACCFEVLHMNCMI